MLRVRKRGSTYRLDGHIAGERIRLALGTRNHDAALLFSNKIERALAEGRDSALWPDLAGLLPAGAFEKFASIVGYTPKLPDTKPTWSSLLSMFTTHCEERVASQQMSTNTWARYQQTIREFEAFLSERNISNLADIKRSTVEQFKAWRLERIKRKKFSRGGRGLALDVAILHRAFSYGVELELLERNPVKTEGRPGNNPEGGAQPFTAQQLSFLRENAGPDLLSFLLLRYTGLRGGDAVSLLWEEIDFGSRELNRLTQKRRKRVILPIHAELLFALEAEFNKRQPRLEEAVLLNPETDKPLTRPRLYERMKAMGHRSQVADVHPHRFRDTFAVDMLAKGASPFDVAKMLGDTVETVERYYAPWVRELRERARRIMETENGLEGMMQISERPGTKVTHSYTSAAKPN